MAATWAEQIGPLRKKVGCVMSTNVERPSGQLREAAPWYADFETGPVNKLPDSAGARAGLGDILAAWMVYVVLLAVLVIFAALSDIVSRPVESSGGPEIEAQRLDLEQTRLAVMPSRLLALKREATRAED